jgi:flagellar hook-basal body complex protein FliE
MSIPALTAASLTQIPQIPLAAATGAVSAPSDFSQVLNSAINQVEQTNRTADTAVGKFLSGEEGELHTTVLATQKADLQFDMFMQVRNKVIGAYQEIMRMQL